MSPLHPRPSEAGGKVPILSLLGVGRNWKTEPAEHCRSVEVKHAVDVCKPIAPQLYSLAERRLLLEIARQAIREAVTPTTVSAVGIPVLTEALQQPRGCFVTLTERGRLRGCVGHIFAQQPLYIAVKENAEAAARHDPRFAPVEAAELASIKIEISVLTEPQPLVFQSNEELLQYLQHDQPGVVLRLSERIVTYLPQVWTRIPDPLMFLDSLCEKAGYMPGVWRQGGTISTYRAECFQELASAPPNQAK